MTVRKAGRSVRPDGRTFATGEQIPGRNSGSAAEVIVTRDARTADRDTLAAGIDDGSVSLWNVRTGALLETLKGHSAAVSDLVFSPHGRTLSRPATTAA